MKSIAVSVSPTGRRDFFWLGGNFSMWSSSPVRGLGFNISLGGIFTSPPVAVASTTRRRVVVVDDTGRVATTGGAGGGGTGGGHGAVRDTAHVGNLEAERDPDAGSTTTGTVPTDTNILQQRVHRLDLFGLGSDYALYHKAVVETLDENDLSPWSRLDGTFTSAPAAVLLKDRIHVFGVGMDRAMYTKSVRGDSWTPAWQRLGGAFTSAPAAITTASGVLHLFVRGADFSLRANRLDGEDWASWQNHGGELASPPVAIALGENRIDVFAIFGDRALWHRWWDGDIWNEWESLGGDYTGEPAVASMSPGRLDVFAVGIADGRLHQHTFENDTWYTPTVLALGTDSYVAEAPTVVSAGPDALEMFVPTRDGHIRIMRFGGGQWQPSAAGTSLRMPCRYRFSVDSVRVLTTRATNADTAAAAASVLVGNMPVLTKTQWIGRIGGITNPKTAQTNLLDFEPVTVELAEPMSFSYIVVNNGHAEQHKVLSALASASDSLSLAGSSSMQEDIAKNVAKIVSVKLSALIASIPVAGSILAPAAKWLMGKMQDALFESCDGVVAGELRAMTGKDLFEMTRNGREAVKVTTRHAGTDSPGICGSRSDYEVTWTIKPL